MATISASCFRRLKSRYNRPVLLVTTVLNTVINEEVACVLFVISVLNVLSTQNEFAILLHMYACSVYNGKCSV